MSETLEQVLADERGAAQVLRAKGDPRGADLIDGVVDRVRAAAEDFVTWLSEGDARLRSGRSMSWLRGRFAEWAESGHARMSAKNQREYRQVVVPRRANVSAAREAGRRGERRSA